MEPLYLTGYSPEQLTELFNTDKREEVLIKIAEHQNTPKEIFEELSQSDSVNIRLTVAKNEWAPKEVIGEVLAKLARDSEFEVRKQAVINRNTPDHVLSDVVDNDWEKMPIRLAVAENRGASGDTLRKVWQLVKKAMKRPDNFPGLDKNDLDQALLKLAGNRNTPETILIRIACFNRRDLDEALLINGRPKVLPVLFDSKFPYIRGSAKEIFKRRYVRTVKDLKYVNW